MLQSYTEMIKDNLEIGRKINDQIEHPDILQDNLPVPIFVDTLVFTPIPAPPAALKNVHQA